MTHVRRTETRPQGLAGSIKLLARLVLALVFLAAQAQTTLAAIVNDAVAIGNYGVATVSSPISSASVPLAAATVALDVTKTGTLNDDDGTPGLSPGDTIDFEITAENSGNAHITSVSVTDDLTTGVTTLSLDAPPNLVGGDISDPGVLNPGETWIWTATYTITAADLAGGFPIINRATVSGVASGLPVSDTSSVVIPISSNPNLSVIKTANTPSFSLAGQTVSWNVSVTNGGGVTINTITVSDPTAESVVCPVTGDETITTLTPGASVDCIATQTVSAADLLAGAIVNTVTATGEAAGPIVVSGTDTAVINGTGADLVTVKTAQLSNPVPLPGDTIGYTITVTNNGPQTATNISLSDQLPPELAPDAFNGVVSGGTYSSVTGLWTIPSLTPGTSATLQLSGTLTTGYGGTVLNNTTTAAVSDQPDPDTSTDILSVDFVPGSLPIDAVNDTTTSPVDSTNAVAGVLNVFDNDLLGAGSATPSNATVVTIGSMPAGITLNPDGTVDVAAGTDPGNYTFDYALCEIAEPGNCDSATVTVEVIRTTPSVSGVIYLDVNSNGIFDGLDQVQPGYTVSLVDAGGTTVASTTTGTGGDYLFGSLTPGTYSIVFTDPSGMGVGIISNVLVNIGDVIVDQNMPVDPAGVVYDSVTGAPIAGAAVRMVNTNSGTALPAACLLPGQQGQVTGANGFYRFDIVPGAAAACPVGETAYSLEIVPPAGYVAPPSSSIVPQGGALNALTCPDDVVPGGSCALSLSSSAPPVASPTPYYLSFLIGAGYPDIVNNHVPLDPVSVSGNGDLSITKQALRLVARRGEVVSYTITVGNRAARPYGPLVVTDRLPPGFAFVPGSATVDGARAVPVMQGRAVIFEGLTIPASGTISIVLSATVGATVRPGSHVNIASLSSTSGSQLAPDARAMVRVEGEPVFDCGDVIGKVYDDKNRNGYQDPGEPGIPAARVATVRGTLITADQFGRFSVPCAELPDSRTGSNFILKLDTRSLPTGYRLTTENPRVVRLTAGKVTELNFGVAASRVVRIDLDAQAFRGDSARPQPALDRGIDQLVTALESEPSVLRLTYYRAGEDRALARARLDAVRDLISERWKARRNREDLPVETRIVDR